MSSDRIFSIIGDANVKRNMTQLNVASREAMKSAQVIECISLSTLDAALNDVRGEAVVLIVASITEFIISNGFSGTVQSSIEPVLGSYVTKICSFCAFRPQLQVRCLDRSTELLGGVSRSLRQLGY